MRGRESKWNTNIIIHYTHEQRLSTYKKHIHELWNQKFNQTAVINTRLIIDNRNSKNLKKQSIQRHPQT
jgi:hypothetical protein